MFKYFKIIIGKNKFKSTVKFVLITIVSIGLFMACAKSQNDEKPEQVNDKQKDDKKSEQMYENFDASNFSNPTNITNEWMPLKPGMRYVFEGTTLSDENDPLPHRVEIHITDFTKVIDGLNTVVAWDLDYSDEQLVEAELAFFAQDNDGNVWRMGEYPVEYEEGEVVATPCWLSGIEDAIAGISMRGNPELGSPSYSQGWGPGVGFTDRGQVYNFETKTCVPLDCYEDVLVIRETSLAEPDAFQLKYWAKGIGNVKVGWGGEGEKTQEILELVEMTKLDDEAFAEVRKKALELEEEAYKNSKNVYGKTSPLKVLGE
jgi:hypothetical protein